MRNVRHAPPAPIVPAWRVGRPVVAAPRPSPEPASIEPPVLAAYENPVPLVTRLVAAETGVSVEAIRSISRRTHHVRARQIVMFVLRNQWGASLPKIGRFLGRDHTTVLHGVRQVEQHPIRFEPEISRVLEAVRKGRKP